MQKSLITLIVFLFMATSCTMEKRRYNRGWHVEYFGNNKRVKNKSDLTKPRAGHYVSSEKIEHFYKLNDSLTGNTLLAEASFGEAPLSIVQNKPKENHLSEVRVVTAPDNHKIKRQRGHNSSEISRPVRSKIQESGMSKAKTNTVKSTKKKSDWLLYVSSGAMAFLALFAIGRNRKSANKVSRWAKENTSKTKLIMAAIQLTLGAMAYWIGYNLNEIGLEFSGSLKFIAFALAGIGLSVIPFFRRTEGLVLPKQLKLRRIGFIGATLAFMLVAVDSGSHTSNNQKGNVFHSAIQHFDQTVFTPIGHDYKSSRTAADLKTNQLEQRKKVVAGLSFGSVLLLVLLGIIFCAGSCIAIWGGIVLYDAIVYGAVAGSVLGGIGLIILGALIIALVIKAWKDIIDKSRAQDAGIDSETLN